MWLQPAKRLQRIWCATDGRKTSTLAEYHGICAGGGVGMSGRRRVAARHAASRPWIRILPVAGFGFYVCAGSRAVMAAPQARPQRIRASTAGIAILRVAKSAFAYKIRPERHALFRVRSHSANPSGNLISRGVVKNIRAADALRPFRLPNGAIWVPGRRVKARFAPLISHFGPIEGRLLDCNQATGTTKTRGARLSVRRATIFDHQRRNYY